MAPLALTFDQVIRQEKSRTNGFDYLRIGLALAVLSDHVLEIADPHAPILQWESWWTPVKLSILPAFFVLSGFLVAGSLARNTIPQFLALRAVRIFPALAVEVTLSAIVLGPLVTDLTIDSYLSSHLLWTYFLNVIGYIHFVLPGVFGGQQVNVQLWTIPFELECYVALVVITIIGLLHRKKLMISILVSVILASTFVAVYLHWYERPWNVPGRVLVFAFLFGVIGYSCKTALPHSRFLFFVCAAATYMLLSFPNLTFLASMPLAYATVYVGLLRFKPIPFGDLSYGLYLFHYPIALSIYELTGRAMPWEALLPATIGLSAVFAALSWRFVERPVLDRKNRIINWVGSAARWPNHLIG
jgi:peptidoglycan/LPS O-acetylase OafA/YrhL